MVVWRLQDSKHPLINSAGAALTGGRWNRQGPPAIYASEDMVVAAMEVIVHHGGIPDDYIGIKIEIPDDVEVGVIDIPAGWPDIVPEAITAEQGTNWLNSSTHAVLRVPSATMSVSGWNYLLNPAHPDFSRISFSFEPVRFDPRLRKRVHNIEHGPNG